MFQSIKPMRSFVTAIPVFIGLWPDLKPDSKSPEISPIKNFRSQTVVVQLWGVSAFKRKTWTDRSFLVNNFQSFAKLSKQFFEYTDVEMVPAYRYLGVTLDNKLDWSTNTKAIYKKGLSRLYFIRRLRSLNVCNKMLQMFCQSVVASTIFFPAVSWGHQDKGCQDDWTNSSGKLSLLLALCLSPWRGWWRTGCLLNCWQSWTIPFTPSTKHWTN